MAGIKLSIHPLFFVLGFFYAVTGQIFIFIICTATAVVHELGHSFVSANLGYRLNKITLMPFGAVVLGDIEGLKFSDQTKIALAGPLINMAVSLFFMAVWWIYPNCYAYTDVVVYSNLSMSLVNLLPIYPLDGGRIVFCYLAQRLGYDKAFSICKIVGGAFSVFLLGVFVLGLISGAINFSLLFFSLFVCPQIMNVANAPCIEPTVGMQLLALTSKSKKFLMKRDASFLIAGTPSIGGYVAATPSCNAFI